MEAWHQLAPEAVLEKLKTRPEGLSATEVESRLQEHGPNELESKPPRSRLSVFLSQFKDLMVVILAGAAGVSFFVNEVADGFVILAIILGNVLIGYFQEFNAEQAVQKLKAMAAQKATVIRDGKPQQVEAAQIVPGDVIRLEAGNTIPADARLIELQGLKVEEAALTGESLPSDKTLDALADEGLNPADQTNRVFKGTAVAAGTGNAVVTETGMKTEMGKIAQMLDTEDTQTPLQQRLAKFTRVLAVIVAVICVGVFGLDYWRGTPLLESFLTALSLAVAALPEALPVVITLGLAQGASRMVKNQALIRRLPAVETLGSVTYICSDKTGTLTLNRMEVKQLEAVEGQDERLAQALLLANEVSIDGDELQGDPTETALVRYALDEGHDLKQARQALPVKAKLPFDSDRMRMSSLHETEGRHLLLVKGAPVKVLERVKASDQDKKVWQDRNAEWAGQGLRVILFAYKELDAAPADKNPDNVETDLNVLGMAGLLDPPREEVKAAIEECHQAGIETVMITGDQPLTATAIARELGMIDENTEEAIAGKDLAKLSEAELDERVLKARVYARVTPEQKLSIVKALQRKGQFVAMTGDGVNDAPSLKQADIGVAMGITGTDVSKEAADMVLLDDNFTTIVAAVREGRRIYENIRKFVQYVLACNLAEILVILLAPILGLGMPLLPIHILWINLVTDGLPGIALASEPAEDDIMRRPPRPPAESLFAGRLAWGIPVGGVVMAGASLAGQYVAIAEGLNLAGQQTMVFAILCLTQLANALSVRAGQHPVWYRFFTNKFLLLSVAGTAALQLALTYVPFLQTLFSTVPLPLTLAEEAGAIVLASLIVLEGMKRVLPGR